VKFKRSLFADLFRQPVSIFYITLSFLTGVRYMFKRNIVGAASAAWLVGVLMFSQAAFAEDAATAKARVEAKQAVEAAQKLLQSGASAEDFVNAVYADDVVMIGGTPGAKRGKAAALAEVKAWFNYMGPNGTKGCSYTMEDPAVVSPNSYASFLNLHCKANPPSVNKDEDYTETYVWKKTPTGWRVALEMWAEGKF
jgi:ketosteroid isomerase-like protein